MSRNGAPILHVNLDVAYSITSYLELGDILHLRATCRLWKQWIHSEPVARRTIKGSLINTNEALTASEERISYCRAFELLLARCCAIVYAKPYSVTVFDAIQFVYENNVLCLYRSDGSVCAYDTRLSECIYVFNILEIVANLHPHVRCQLHLRSCRKRLLALVVSEQPKSKSGNWILVLKFSGVSITTATSRHDGFDCETVLHRSCSSRPTSIGLADSRISYVQTQEEGGGIQCWACHVIKFETTHARTQELHIHSSPNEWLQLTSHGNGDVVDFIGSYESVSDPYNDRRRPQYDHLVHHLGEAEKNLVQYELPIRGSEITNEVWSDLRCGHTLDLNGLLVVDVRRDWLDGSGIAQRHCLVTRLPRLDRNESCQSTTTSTYDSGDSSSNPTPAPMHGLHTHVVNMGYREVGGARGPPPPPPLPGDAGHSGTATPLESTKGTKGLVRATKHIDSFLNEFKFVDTYFRYYNATAQVFIDLVDDHKEPSAANNAMPPQNLRLRIAARDICSNTHSSSLRQPIHRVRRCNSSVLASNVSGQGGGGGGGGGGERNKAVEPVVLEKTFQSRTPAFFPPSDDGSLGVATAAMNPIRGCTEGTVPAMADDHNIVYMVSAPAGERLEQRRVVLVSFDPSLDIPEDSKWRRRSAEAGKKDQQE